MNKNQQLANLLSRLQNELQALSLWQQNALNPELLLSTQPFCVDTLTFEQWLQFVFIPKISQMLAENQPLPNQISLCPMAEESFKRYGDDISVLINLIADIDELLSGQRQQTYYCQS
ncbi:YqcC family protein [Thalassotalea litorea]|uniref:YqcC family protein n=1 Tax=Thalassotalea litorea TaxID=2020715 RepID=A0A5R9ITW4_9GAMM|nr:YqcC family protein [Thalassotalea litorea]TLU67547.1 YqcC family protein [Thalassotalea litorea]